MSVRERYYKRLDSNERKKIADRSRRARMSDIQKQKPVDNFCTRHGAYGRPLPNKNEKEGPEQESSVDSNEQG